MICDDYPSILYRQDPLHPCWLGEALGGIPVMTAYADCCPTYCLVSHEEQIEQIFELFNSAMQFEPDTENRRRSALKE